MGRPLTLVVVLSLLAGVLAFVGTLLSAPAQVGSARRNFGAEVRALASSHKWVRVAALSRQRLRDAPDHLEALMFLGIGEERGGDQAGAGEAWQRLLSVADRMIAAGRGDTSAWYYRGWALRGLGDERGARLAWQEHLDRAPEAGLYNRACYLALAGEREAALEALESMSSSGEGLESIDEAWARVDPDLDTIRDDPRFERALRRARERMQSGMARQLPV